MLMDHPDTHGIGVPGRANRYFLPIDQNLPLVRKVNAGNHIHERGLAAPVFPQDRKDLAAAHLHADVVVCNHLAAEALGNMS